MSPRGVAITGVRERLFEAAERVLAAEGPGGLTSRAVTGAAGCAKGVLHNHFEDLDDFVAQLVLHRFALLAREADALAAQVGQRTVTGNVTALALAVLGSQGPAIAAVAMSRPGASARCGEAWRQGAPGFDAIEGSIAEYLRAEQRSGRFPEAVDCAATALAVVAAAHHLLMTSWPGGPDPHDRLRRLVGGLTSGGVPSTGRPDGTHTAGSGES